jgi:hypothetical protein
LNKKITAMDRSNFLKKSMIGGIASRVVISGLIYFAAALHRSVKTNS